MSCGTFDVRGVTGVGGDVIRAEREPPRNKFTMGSTTRNTAVAGTLDVGGATGVDGDFDVATNKFTVASATGDTAVACNLDVTGATGVDGDFDVATNKFTVSSATGNTTVAGTLDVTGEITSGSTLTVNDTMINGDLTVTGNYNFCLL